MTTFLIYTVLILGVLTIVQLVRVFELSNKLKGTVSEVPTLTENRNQARFLLLFMLGYFAFFIWLAMEFGDKLLPVSASEHGVELDWLLDFNFIIIIIVFVLTHILLFYFCFKYYYRPERKAYFFAHNNKLELVWTIIPAVFLAVIVFYGLASWNTIMLKDAPADALEIELYSKQFTWRARYTGKDSTLGRSNYNMIYGTNELGLINDESIAGQLEEIEGSIKIQKDRITRLSEAGEVINKNAYPEGSELYEATTEEIARLERHKGRVLNIKRQKGDLPFDDANDDVIVKDTFLMPVNTNIHFRFRSQDVIHSAYLPHFRTQMNTVPGTPTEFKMKTTKTTKELREITNNPDFEFWLLCNKICGASHFNMKMVVRVVEQEEFDAWMAAQTQFDGNPVTPQTAEAVTESSEPTGMESEEATDETPADEMTEDEGTSDESAEGTK